MEIKQEQLSKYTSIRTGGIATIFTPNSVKELQEFLRTNTQKILFLGLGSNVLISDSGFDGVVIRTKNLNTTEVQGDTIFASCGTTLNKLAKICSTNNQRGANFLKTIPGSVGGALRMNAGCFGKEMWQGVVSIETIDIKGNIHHRKINDFVVSYRKVVAKYIDEYFIGAHFCFDDSPIADDILQQRYNSQPIGTANFGSVFKNPHNDFAAKLIEEVGLKGYQVGGAQISTTHANFIINTGSATSEDVQKIITHTQKCVEDKCNIALVKEVQVI